MDDRQRVPSPSKAPSSEKEHAQALTAAASRANSSDSDMPDFPGHILQLQKIIGNRSTNQLIQARASHPRKLAPLQSNPRNDAATGIREHLNSSSEIGSMEHNDNRQPAIQMKNGDHPAGAVIQRSLIQPFTEYAEKKKIFTSKPKDTQEAIARYLRDPSITDNGKTAEDEIKEQGVLKPRLIALNDLLRNVTDERVAKQQVLELFELLKKPTLDLTVTPEEFKKNLEGFETKLAGVTDRKALYEMVQSKAPSLLGEYETLDKLLASKRFFAEDINMCSTNAYLVNHAIMGDTEGSKFGRRFEVPGVASTFNTDSVATFHGLFTSFPEAIATMNLLRPSHYFSLVKTGGRILLYQGWVDSFTIATALNEHKDYKKGFNQEFTIQSIIPFLQRIVGVDQRAKEEYFGAHERLDGTADTCRYVIGVPTAPGAEAKEVKSKEPDGKAAEEKKKEEEEKKKKKSKGKCYLTTACVVYKGLSDDCEELTTLRRFRDEYMSTLDNHEQLISLYYKHAPDIVDAINAHQQVAQIYDKLYDIIQLCVKEIHQDNHHAALHIYMETTIYLQDALLTE